MSVETTGTPPATPAAAVAAPPAAAAVQTPTSTAPAAVVAAQPQTVTIPLEQLQAFTAVQARLNELEAQNRTRENETRQREIREMTARGETDAAMRAQQEESRIQIETERVARNTAEERAKRFARDAALGRVLSSRPLVPGAAKQLERLFAPDLIVDAQGESFNVRTASFQDLDSFVDAQLANPEYSHFLRAHNPNGGTAGGPASGGSAAPTSPANPATVEPPKNFGHAIIAQMLQIDKAKPSDSRLDPAQAMGLNHRSMVRTA